MDNDFRLLGRNDIPRAWPTLWPILNRAIERGDGSYAEPDIMMALLAGQWQTWVNEPLTTVAITEIVAFPQQKKLIVRWVAGELDPLMENIGQIVGYAKAHGCRLIEANHARRGWSRLLPGFQEGRVVIFREVPQ